MEKGSRPPSGPAMHSAHPTIFYPLTFFVLWEHWRREGG